MDGPVPQRLTDWQGNPWTPGVGHQGRPSQLALHHPGHPESGPFAALGRPAGRADQRHPVRRSPRAHRAARLSLVRLGARRVSRRDDGLRDHRRGHRRGRRRPPRPDGHAALLRLQHGRLLGALAGDGQAGVEPAGHLPGQLVPHRRPGPLHLARLRREHARPALGARPGPCWQRRESTRARRPSAWCQRPKPSARATLACRPPTPKRCSRSTATTGCAKPRTRTSFCRASAIACRPPSAKQHQALQHRLSPVAV